MPVTRCLTGKRFDHVSDFRIDSRRASNLYHRVDLDIVSFAVAPLGCNCSILRETATNETIVVDPGGDADRIIDLLTEKGCKVKYIVHTHAHFDHVLGTHEVASHCRNSGHASAVCMHPGDLPLYRILPQQCGWFGLPPVEAKEEISHRLEDDEVLSFGRFKMHVLHTPGHTPGSCSFSIAERGILFSGDTLFAGSIGRTDLPGGDYDQIIKSIKDRLMVLDDGTTVIPGHGEFTRIFDEKRTNPFL
jgi:glyoxylase-like metal-dependent hydrolase (beta-lactamase superfamily II)